MMLRKLYCRTRYWYRKAIVTLTGLCPDCHTRLNFSYNGQGHCPDCGMKK